MSVADLFRSIRGNRLRDEEIVGVIVEGPFPVEDGDSSPAILVFRLDSRPDLVFRQTVSVLAPDRKRGDRVKVHCRTDGNGIATVDWVEQA